MALISKQKLVTVKQRWVCITVTSSLSTLLVSNLSKGNWNFRSQELSLTGAKVPYMSENVAENFVPMSENVVELSLTGANITWIFRSQERKCHETFAPGYQY